MFLRAVNGDTNDADWCNNTKKENLLYHGWGDFSRFETNLEPNLN